MENQSQNQATQPQATQPKAALPSAQQPATASQTSTPAQTPAPASAAQPAAKPAQPAQQSATLKAASASASAVAPLPKDQTKSNRKLLVGCISAFGCSLLLFLGVLFAFLAFGSPENPIFQFFGVPKGEVVNVLITLVNLIFLVLVFIAFIFVVIGVFKITAAKKDDKEAKRKGSIFTFVSLASLVILVFIWIFIYVFLAQKQTVVQKAGIITEPAITTNLTAPIAIKFDGSKTGINKNAFELLGYSWDFGDGTVLTDNPQSHTFTELGNFKVKLTVTTKEKATGKEKPFGFEKEVTIQNVRANVVIKTDKQKGEAPLTVNLDGKESSSPNGEITAYAWDLNEDGKFDDGDKSEAQVTFDKIGTYKISLRVTDSTGEFSIGDLEIEATASNAPKAVMTVEGVEGTTLENGKAYMFSAASSLTPNGTIEKYSWDFGDGGKASTRTATHTYKTTGMYDVTLAIINSNKEKGEVTVRFNVTAPSGSPVPFVKTTPEAKNNIITGQAPLNVIFDASASKDPNDNIVEYAWDFDNDEKTDDANAITSYTFNAAGTYNVSLTITDSTDLTAKTQIIVKVEAAGLKPDVIADPISGVVPLTVNFDASGSSYAEGKIVSFEWDFGDGTAPRIDTAKVSHKYTAIGTFTVKTTAITSDNKKATAQTIINVRAVPVKSCFEPNVNSGKAPLEVQFDPTCSTGTIVKYFWDFAKLSSASGYKPKFTFKDPGEYNVTLEVTDNQNNTDKYSKSITVTLP